MKNLISLDSLTDIVSNSVGILIIFAVINLIHDNHKTYQLEIPIEHKTELQAAFFIIKNDRILALDMDTIFANAMQQTALGAAKNKRLFSLDYQGLLGKVDEDKGMYIHARDTREWPKASDLGKRTSPLTTAVKAINANKQFAYFFVYDTNADAANSDEITGDSFETFRKARKYLKKLRIKTGWQPVNNDQPANFCDSIVSRGCEHLPSYLGDS